MRALPLPALTSVLCALFLVAACDGSTSVEEKEPGDESAAIVVGSDCSNEEAAASDLDARRDGVIEADVTGDGEEDEVHLHLAPDGEEGCRAFVVVTGGSFLSAPIAGAEESLDLGFPALTLAAEIDERPGSEVVVTVMAGAATEFVAIYSAGGEVLERLSVEDTEPPLGDLFGFGGSVGNLEAVDCREGEGGRVVASVARPVGARYRIDRRFYRTNDGILELGGTDRMRVDEDGVFEVPEFGSSPFGSCPA